MANHISHAAQPYIKNARYTLLVAFLDADGDPTDPTTPDTEVSQDGAAFADAAEEVTTVSTGFGFITLTGAEMNNSAVMVALKAASGPKTTPVTIYPKALPTVESGTAQAGANGSITLAAGAAAYDLTGCYVRTTGGTGGGGTGGANNQARRITAYNTGTKVATVVPNWETNPANDTTYDILLPEELTMAALKGLLPTTLGRTLAVSTGGVADANLAQILGTALTETSGYIAAGFKKFFNVGSPTGTVNSLPDAVPGAASGLSVVGSQMNLADDAITSGKFDESTAFPVKQADTGATALARSGADGDTLKGLSDQLDTAQADLDNPGQYKADVSALATAVELAKVPKSDGTASWNATALAAIVSQVTSALNSYDPPTRAELTSDISSILTKLRKYIQLVLRKDAAIATDNSAEVTEINADGGSGSGSFNNTTDAQEALRDNQSTPPTVTQIRQEMDSNSTQLSGIKAKTDNLPASPAAVGSQMNLVDTPNATAINAIQNGLATLANQNTILARLGSWAGTGINNVLGAFQALFRKDASAPSDIGGTFSPTTDSVEAIRDTEPLGTPMRGTDGAAPASTALVNTTWTDARAAKLDNLDTNVGSRLATSGYTAPDNLTIAAIALAVANLNNLSSAQAQAAVAAALAAYSTAKTGDAMALIDSAITAAKIAAGAISASALAADTSTYQAKVWMLVDEANAADRYFTSWYKNGGRVSAGITSPTIQVVKVSDGTDLVASAGMTQVGATGVFYYNEATNRVTAGAVYIALVSATIDGSPRTWTQWLGRDSSAP